MSDKLRSRGRCGEAFWRARHEAWVQSELNQRSSIREAQSEKLNQRSESIARLTGFHSSRPATGVRSSKPNPSRRLPSCSIGAAA